MATPTLEPTPDAGPPEPQADRLIEHVRVLSEEIGPRVAGSPAYDDAVAYARGQFESYGYDVEVQRFTASHRSVYRYTTLAVALSPPRDLFAVSFAGSGAGAARGWLIDAGTGRVEEFPADASGAVVLVQRQDVTFADMAQRAEDAGASAVIVSNNELGPLIGTADPATDLPMVAVSQEDGEALRGLLAAGQVEVDLNVRAEVETASVIARPRDGVCRTVSGGHLDSVPWAAGAKDNAAGSAIVLELARAAAQAGLNGHCFALWGAEELGLLGSRHFVSVMSEAERADLIAYLNYDAAAGDATLLAIGDGALLERADAVARLEGIPLNVDPRSEEARSDHASFLEEGMPAVMLSNPDFDRGHTPQDTFDLLEADSIAPLARLGFAMLRDLS